MKGKFTPEFFQDNRKRLCEVFGGQAPIILTANGLIQRTRDDDTYEFHQDSSFWYLSGIDDPNFILVIDKDKQYLIGPDINERWRVFHGDMDLDKFAKISGADEVLSYKQGWQKLSKRLKKVKHVATLVPPEDFDERFQVYSNPARRRLVKQLKSHNSSLQFIDLTKHIVNLRMVKQAPEIETIQQTVDETMEVYKLIGKKLESFKNERELSAEIDYLFAKKGLNHSFRQIVAGGKNAVTLHYVRNDAPIEPGKVLLLDIGASKANYCSDLTRTVSAKPTKRQLAVYDAVMQVREFALKMLRPGVQLASYESAIRHYMGEKLRELGLIKIIDEQSVGKYYPHSTSHFLGIDVHDVGNYQKPLPAGAVLTVEPGIYIPEENIGIRIEDDVLLTETGNRVMSDRLSRELTSLKIA
ncbi:MAG TPA: Xaa-Pro aminopeptidase [Candidatus Saccharimonadales bacterium]|nr:Xaa-Pro aminopeptidase [Candidatus Saccharimonadales bacterium]